MEYGFPEVEGQKRREHQITIRLVKAMVPLMYLKGVYEAKEMDFHRRRPSSWVMKEEEVTRVLMLSI